MAEMAAIRRPDDRALADAAAALREGSLVAFPTETVYGLGAHARDPDAVARVFAAKGRPQDNPLIVHLADADSMDQLVASISPLAAALAARFWPGPLTVVLDARPDLPRRTTGGLETVAVRVPDHPVAMALLREVDLPVAAPSANRSGRPSPTRAEHVAADFGGEVAVILDGGTCALGVESTVVDARGDRPVVLREGSIPREELGEVAEPVGGQVNASPGTRYRHYAPSCRIEIAPRGGAPGRAASLRDRGQRVGTVARAAAPEGVVEVARFDDAAELAQCLYAALRDAELAGVEVLVVEEVVPRGIGRAVMDRLRRAAAP